MIDRGDSVHSAAPALRTPPPSKEALGWLGVASQLRTSSLLSTALLAQHHHHAGGILVCSGPVWSALVYYLCRSESPQLPSQLHKA